MIKDNFGRHRGRCQRAQVGSTSLTLRATADIDGLPTLAGGNGTLEASVGLDGSSAAVVATAGFSACDSTTDILNTLDSVFSSATLPSGAIYAGIIDGSPVFYSTDVRPLSAGFSVSSTDELDFVTGAAIYYVPETTVPTVSAWGMVALTLMFALGAKLYFGRRHQDQTG